MRIGIYENGEVYVPDPLLGFVGETNNREITFDFQNVTGATAYTLRIDYPDGTAYSVPIVGKKFTVTGSMLPAAGKVKAQWLAYASTTENNETVYTLVGKSRIFELEIGESLDDDVEPIPPYEKSVEAAETLIQVGENFTQGYVTELREFINETNFQVGVGTSAQIASAEIPEHALVIPTDGSDVAEFTRMSTLTADTGWVTIPSAAFKTGWSPSGDGVQVRKIGSHVYIRGRATLSAEATTSGYNDILTIPEGYRPATANTNRLNLCVDHTMVELIANNATLAEDPGVLWTYRVIDSSFTTGFVSLAGKTVMIDLDYFLD